MGRTSEPDTLDPAAVSELAAQFRGRVVIPGDPSYAEDRAIWNGAIDRRPAVIARCAGVADIIAAVKLARRTGCLAAVRSGGPTFPPHPPCARRVCIPPSPM